MGFLIIAIALSALQLVSARDYCSIPSCNGKTHVGCPIPTIPKGPSCSSFTAITYSESQRNQFLALHNEKRNTVASGKAVSRPKDGSGAFYLPSGSNINKLSWDPELALLASYNVRQCKMAHDSCRNTDQYVGQNLYVSWGNAANTPIETIIQGAINSWYNEINKFDVAQIDKFTGANGVGHFTQFVWALTTKLGCAGSKWLDGSEWYFLVACNYKVGGNYDGAKVYNRGPAGSACASRDNTYTSLCA